MSEFTLLLVSRDQAWMNLREQLACAARDIHFHAISNDAVNGTALLAFAAKFAGLALSIPMRPTQETLGGSVEASTLFAAQHTQHNSRN